MNQSPKTQKFGRVYLQMMRDLLTQGLVPWQFVYNAYTRPFQTPFIGSPLQIFIGIAASPVLMALGFITLIVASTAMLLVTLGFLISTPLPQTKERKAVAEKQTTCLRPTINVMTQNNRQAIHHSYLSPRSADLRPVFFGRAISEPIAEEDANDAFDLQLKGPNSP